VLKYFFFKKKLFNNKSSLNKKLIYHSKSKQKKKHIKIISTKFNNFLWSPTSLLTNNTYLITNYLGSYTLILKKNINNFNLMSNNIFFQKLFNVGYINIPFYLLDIKMQIKSFTNLFKKYSFAYNSYSCVLSKSKTKIIIGLPSGKKHVIWHNQDLNITNLNNIIFRSVKKSIVRGIAKNPVDHPNGGNSNIKKPFRTPWAFIAKKGK
jgi:hypothetical protein